MSSKWYKKFAKFREEETDPDKRDIDTTRDIRQERKLLQHILHRQWRKTKENVSKYSREKNYITHQGKTIRIISDCLIETYKARGLVFKFSERSQWPSRTIMSNKTAY